MPMSQESGAAPTPACAGRAGLGGTLELRVRREQYIADVSFPDPCVILVTRGHKTLSAGDQQLGAGPGELLFINAGVTAAMRNRPDADGVYAATCVAMAPDLVRAHAAARNAVPGSPWRALSHAPAQSTLADVVRHAAAGMLGGPTVSDRLIRHRLEELLIALDDLGCWCRISTAATAAERVRGLLAGEPAANWTAAAVAQRLHMSEASLRRALRGEATGFRAVLDDVRMSTGLALIQGSAMSLQQIAGECGYASPSRFAARFRQRFGVTPSSLRR
ncbi:MAG: helix-turn-helix domain-containing protein [Denitromonas halophila]|nr:MAG: helix-turn-helix domain-containing protein [Denitromonas halophila]TVT71713.1 MAG: helix-turn-helix domain-containing protein [Denitromonas halophila]